MAVVKVKVRREGRKEGRTKERKYGNCKCKVKKGGKKKKEGMKKENMAVEKEKLRRRRENERKGEYDQEKKTWKHEKTGNRKPLESQRGLQ